MAKEEHGGGQPLSALQTLKGDKRFWYCVTVYPLLFLFLSLFRRSGAVAFLTTHSPLFFLITFLGYGLCAVCTGLDIFNRLFSFKVQGRALVLQEKEKERIRRDG